MDEQQQITNDGVAICYAIVTVIMAIIGLSVASGIITFEQIRQAIGNFIEWFYSVYLFVFE